MKNAEQIRNEVRKAYSKAVSGSKGGSCCSREDTKGVAAKLAGYSPEELKGLPSEAVVNSFGCGNPLAFAELTEGEVVLDLGSGAGIDVILAGEKVGSTGRAIGVDMTDPMIAKARENIVAAKLSNAEVRKGTIEDLPVESESVNWVISNCVINLSPDKAKVFSEISRVLKAGGRMRVADIVVEGLPDWIRVHQGLFNSCVAGGISEDEYIAGLRTAGLEDVKVGERLVYDASQIAAFIRSGELPGGVEDLIASEGLSIDQIAESLTGKVWHALFLAKKPE